MFFFLYFFLSVLFFVSFPNNYKLKKSFFLKMFMFSEFCSEFQKLFAIANFVPIFNKMFAITNFLSNFEKCSCFQNFLIFFKKVQKLGNLFTYLENLLDFKNCSYFQFLFFYEIYSLLS